MHGMLAHVRLAVAFAALVAVTASMRTHAENVPAIVDAASLDRYLATTAPGGSPLDRLSRSANRRFVEMYRKGSLDVWDLQAELTRDEAREILVLFGLEADVPGKMRNTHLDLGRDETPATSAAMLRIIAFSKTPGAALAEYRRTFAPRQNASALRAMSDGDVALSLRAAAGAEGYARDAQLDLDELSRRGVSAPNWIPRVYAKWISQRDFAAATAFRQQHADANLPAPPRLRDEAQGKGPTVLDVADNGIDLVRRTLVLDPKAQVVVIGGCHFSEDATRDIEADPKLHALFSHHVVWIAQGTPADPEVAQWNREHPIAALHIVYRESEWPAIDTWRIPTFYFLRDGKVVSKVVSWEGNRDKVIDGFRTLGLAP